MAQSSKKRKKLPIPGKNAPGQNVTSLIQEAVTCHRQGQIEQAKSLYEKVLRIQPNNFDALHLLGVVAAQQNQLHEAIASYDKAIKINPANAGAYYNRANALRDLKYLNDAIASYDQALAIKPDYAIAHYNRANVLKDGERLDEAVASYDKAIAIKPDYADAYYNRANVLSNLNRLDEAIASYDTAIAIKPDYAEAYYNRANVLRDLNRLEEALGSYDKAILFRSDFAEAHNNRGNVLKDLHRLDEALASYDQALAIKPDYAEAYNNRGNAFKDLMRLDEALASYDQALAIKPDYDFLFGVKLLTQMRLCDWTDVHQNIQALEQNILSGNKSSGPFPVLALLDKPHIQLQAARMYANECCPDNPSQTEIKPPTPNAKIRIGYYSADFHNHATAFLMAELFEAHDPERFELYGFSFGPDARDEMRLRITDSFDHFYDVNQKSDQEVAQLSRELGIDIAVDLKGYTQDSRTGIFAQRCAPIQVNYLGYPGTMGMPYIDYIIADKTLVPQESQQYYTEKVVYMPNSYQVNDSKRQISDRVFTREELGLPEDGFVFCCFNNNYKILPTTFDIWMRLLEAVEGSVLWLLEDNPTAARNLQKEASARGVDPARLVFAKRMKLAEHLARHRHADLFVDTWPCNAHTTASDALWAGLPVLTYLGESFACRVAGSLLNAIDMPELMARTPEQYEAMALELARSRKSCEQSERNWTRTA